MAESRPALAVAAAAYDNDPRSAPLQARRSGFGGLLFDAYSSALSLPDLSASGRREFLHLLSAQQQKLVGVRWDVTGKGLRPGGDVDQVIERLDRVMETAKGLVSPLVCTDLGPLPEPPAETKPRPKVSSQEAGLILLPTPADVARAADVASPERAAPPPDPSFVSQVDAALVEFCRRADRYGVVLAIRSELSSFAAIERCLRAANCPWFGIDLDPVALLRDAWEIDEVFSRLGSLVRHVRARDATRGADRRTKPAVVGRGDTDWEHLLANLDGADYSTWITVDPVELPDRAAAASAALKYLLSKR
jgi:hypothetical protein